MKIAYLCADPGIPVLGNKGASVHVREFTDALVELGHRVHIYSAAGTAENSPPLAANATRAPLTVLAPSEQIRGAARILAEGFARLDSPHQRPHLFSELLHITADPEFVNAALPSLRDFAPDLVIARHALFSTAGRVIARALQCRYVLEVNAPLVEERRRYWGLQLEREAEQIERQAFAGADLLVAVSEGVRAHLERYGAPRERVIVLANGVDPSHFHPEVDGRAVRRRYGLESKVVVGFVGSLKPWHGVDLLLRTFASIYRMGRSRAAPGSGGLALLLVGDGPERAPLEQESQALGLSEAVTFTGAVPHFEIPEHLAAIDIAVAPYVASNGFYFSPLKVMEYMAMGRAVVAPMLGQLPSLLQDEAGACGILYPADDPHELALALWRLVGDGALRAQLGARATAQARLHGSWQAIAQEVVDRAARRMNPSAADPLGTVAA